MTISKLTRPSLEAAADISHLLTELRENIVEHKASLKDLSTIVADKNTILIVAKDGKKIVGMATLYILQKFSKRIGHVEDVIVDSTYRGKGLGKLMMRAIIGAAKTKKVLTLSLTSRPARVAGNKLYQGLGFEQKETNVYRMKL